MARFRLYLSARWRRLLVIVGCLAAVSTVLLYKLGSLTPGLSSLELAIQPWRTEAHAILHNPLYLPFKLLDLLVGFTPYHGYTAARLPSVICAAAILALFIYLVRSWYGPRTAWFGAVLLACAPWYLHIGRLATPDVLYPLGILSLLAYCTRLQKEPSPRLFLATPIVFALQLYIPGFIWMIALCLFWYRTEFIAAWRFSSLRLKSSWLVLWPVGLSLLGYAFWRSPELAKTWAGLPTTFPTSLTYLHAFGAVWLHIFVRGPQTPLLGLGYLPLLNVFVSAMCIVGGYFYVKHWRAPRSRLLFSLSLVSSLLIALNGPVSLAMILPILLILAAGGLGYLLHDWLKVFPRNPFARALGYTLVTLVVGFSSLYNLRQYFIAWSHNTETRAVFSRRL